MSVQPRSFLVIGSLGQFQSEHGVNSARYTAFENFRRNLRQPVILSLQLEGSNATPHPNFNIRRDIPLWSAPAWAKKILEGCINPLTFVSVNSKLTLTEAKGGNPK